MFTHCFLAILGCQPGKKLLYAYFSVIAANFYYRYSSLSFECLNYYILFLLSLTLRLLISPNIEGNCKIWRIETIVERTYFRIWMIFPLTWLMIFMMDNYKYKYANGMKCQRVNSRQQLWCQFSSLQILSEVWFCNFQHLSYGIINLVHLCSTLNLLQFSNS